ncbi:hypothetical protein SAMN05444156_2431 [Verrucomicrobium sp. GAS474]|uniref:hypothetical protein n=1 Tax=Verrucomicrobium sp. GAS474 TaxID=1882831 RepID=UPI00087D613B|nr:hypothetical protein [Verrucomicrobium sp. GAS474]SDU17794.1 hypothetical protein SAMN05444156_2431 [Verrucomicrobium sp. GAS474]
MKAIAENLWIEHFDLNVLGGHLGRVVTVIRLKTGELIIHSTAPFSRAHVAEIEALGRPSWLVDSMLRHDTFAKEGRAAFPYLPYLAPEGFAEAAHVNARPLLPPPAAWRGEVEVLLIEGMPKAKEHVFLHIPSRTLIVADLVFNFGPSSGWTHFLREKVVGIHDHPDVARNLPGQIEDRAAFDRSVRRMLEWDFDRIIAGHNEVVETGGKEGLRRALANHDVLPAG